MPSNKFAELLLDAIHAYENGKMDEALSATYTAVGAIYQQKETKKNVKGGK